MGTLHAVAVAPCEVRAQRLPLAAWGGARSRRPGRSGGSCSKRRRPSTAGKGEVQRERPGRTRSRGLAVRRPCGAPVRAAPHEGAAAGGGGVRQWRPPCGGRGGAGRRGRGPRLPGRRSTPFPGHRRGAAPCAPPPPARGRSRGVVGPSPCMPPARPTPPPGLRCAGVALSRRGGAAPPALATGTCSWPSATGAAQHAAALATAPRKEEEGGYKYDKWVPHVTAPNQLDTLVV